MSASVQKLSRNRKINPNNECLILCTYCAQKYVLV
jgi:2-iminoacetate synthase ThiH